MSPDGQTGDVDVVKRAAAIWVAEDDITSKDSQETIRSYRVSEIRKLTFVFVCVIAAIIVAGLSITYGTMDIGFFECYEVIWNHITGNIDDKLIDFIIVNERLPRIAAALITGAGLAIAS